MRKLGPNKIVILTFALVTITFQTLKYSHKNDFSEI